MLAVVSPISPLPFLRKSAQIGKICGQLVLGCGRRPLQAGRGPGEPRPCIPICAKLALFVQQSPHGLVLFPRDIRHAVSPKGRKNGADAM